MESKIERPVGQVVPNEALDWCDVHHWVHWADGGSAILTNLLLACPAHHYTAHHTGWQVRIAADGLAEWIPPTRIDPQQRPRRHHRHKKSPAAPPE